MSELNIFIIGMKFLIDTINIFIHAMKHFTVLNPIILLGKKVLSAVAGFIIVR